jgi:tetratricopeptide (TPR) repeat protein
LFEKACSLNANDLNSRRALLQFYYSAGRYQDALRVSEEILQKSMHDVSALRCRALALQYVYPDQAEAAFEALLRQSADADDWLAFAMFYYRRQQYKYARLLFQEVLKSREVDTSATTAQLISSTENNHSTHLTDERSTPLAEIYRYLGDCSWHLGDYTAMSLWYTRLVEAKPADTAALQIC